MAYINDKQPIPVASVFLTNPPTYDQSETGRGEIYYQNPDESIYIESNGQTGPLPSTPTRTRSSVVHYINIVWATFNAICCLWPLGCCAFALSYVALVKLRDGEKKNAKVIGISTAVINVLATIGGTLLFVFYFLPLIEKHRQS